MKKTSLLLWCALFIFSIGNITQAQTISYGTAGSPYTQDFNTLPNSGTFTFTGGGPFNLNAAPVSASGLTGWYGCKYSGTATNMVFLAENGTSNAGGVHNYGATSATDRALGCLASAGNIDEIGALITNNTGVTLTQITISFTGEQWRIGSGSANTISFQYKIGASSINDATGYVSNSNLNFTSPNTAKGDSATNGNSAGDRTSVGYTITGLVWNNGDVLGIRWQDANDTGNDDGLAIDDFTFSAAFQSTASFSVNGTLTPFLQTSSSPSAEQTYNVIGTGLTTNVNVVPPAGFEISKTTGSGFVKSTGSLIFTAADVIAGKTIYVRMDTSSPGSYTGSITHTSAGFEFTQATQSVSGTNTISCTLSLTALIEGFFNGSIMVPDTISVELRDANTLALVDQKKGLLNANGMGTFAFNNAVNGSNYYIIVKHRNSVETWSANAQSFSAYALSYNFTNSATQAYGSNLVSKGGKFCIYSGDVNQDGVVDSGDLGIVDNDNASYVSGYTNTDINGDGLVDSGDLGITDNNNAIYISKNIPVTAPVFLMTGTIASFFQTSSSPSTEQTYNISGANLATNVTVVPPAGFEISKTTSTGFVTSSGSLVFTAADVMAGKTIYVRMNASSTGSYSGFITHTSAGSEFTQATKSVSGTYSIVAANVNLTMGNPSNATTDVNFPHNYLLDKPQFCAGYDRDKGIPIWTSWQLNSTWCNGPAVRKDNYIVDPTLPAGWPRVDGNDFSGSGFARGHMCPSADRLVTQADNDALFVMTNLIPQNENNNSGIWEQLENYERALANAGNTLYIISGGYGAGGTGTNGYLATIQQSGYSITVPAKLWKVMIVIPAGSGNDLSRVTTSTRTIAVIMDNANPTSGDTWGAHRVSVDAVESLTGFDFFSNVSTSIQAVIEANVDNGPTQ